MADELILFGVVSAFWMLGVEIGHALGAIFGEAKRLAREEEMEERFRDSGVEYCGHTDDVRPFLADCSVFVLPSYHEGMPRSVIEAMAVGRAIITTDVPGCRETVAEGQNGFLVPVKDGAALAEKMLLLARDASLRERMGEESYRICSEKFEVGKVNAAMYGAMLAAIDQ